MIALQWLLMLVLITSTWSTEVSTFAPISKRVVNKQEKCPSCSCGVGNNNRIVGGVDSNVNKFPWVAMLLSEGQFRCGGSLITNKYVMTAAHCVSRSQASRYELRFLQNQLNTTSADRISRKISQIIVHPKYNSRTMDNDIALLKLTEPIQFNDKIRPVCLPSTGNSFTGQDATVIGWGARKQNGNVVNQLQEVSVPILTNRQCRSYGLSVTSNMICAGLTAGKKDSCQGDSGGPLHVINNSKLTQAGIVSWGIGCGSARRPGVYTKVSSFTSWIRTNTADSCSC